MAGRFRFLSAKEVLSELTNYTLTHTTKLNDFTEGSALETLYEAYATTLEQYYYLNIENIKTSIQDSIYTSFGFYRKPELKAYGTVTLTFNQPLTSDLTIAAGTQFSSSNSYFTQTYETLDEFTVPAGVDAYDITVYCTQGGTFGNIPAGVIDTGSNVGSVDSIVNTESFQTGQEAETLAETRQRFRQFIQAIQKGSIQAIQYGALNVPNVYSIYLDETPGMVKVYADDANGDLSNDLRVQIQNELYYWRSAGVPVEVLPVHKTTADVDVTLTVPNKQLQTSDLENNVGVILNNYLNSLAIGDSVNVNGLIKYIMDSSSAITDAQANLMINPDAALRGSLTVNDSNSIILNEHLFPKSVYQPVDRSVDDHYLVSNPEDWDNQDWSDTTTTTMPLTTTTTTTASESFPDDNFEQQALSNRIKLYVNRELSAGNVNLQGLNWEDISGNKPSVQETDYENTPMNLNDAVNQMIKSQVSQGKLDLHGTSWHDVEDAVNFALEDTGGNNDSGLIPGPDSTEKNPIYLGTQGVAQTFDYGFKDGATVGFVSNNNYGSMSSLRYKFKDGSQLTINQVSQADSIPYTYYKSGDTTGVTGTLAFDGTDEKGNNTLNDLTIAFSKTGITVTNNTFNTISVINYNQMTINYTYATGTNTLVTVNNGDPNNTFNSDVEVGDNLHFVYDFTDTGALNMFYTNFKVTSTNNTIKSYYDGQGNTIRVDTYNASGNLISSVDGSGNSLISTTLPNGNINTTTSTSTVETTIAPTTTTTTTIYPFSIIQPVSATDAPNDGYLPVFGEYDTSSNEVVKAGTIKVTFK